jgi:hypothetical protein
MPGSIRTSLDRRTATALLVAGVFFMENLDATVIATALPALVAPILGPPVGGWLSAHWSWRWIFLLNLPLGLLVAAGFAASAVLTAESPREWIAALMFFNGMTRSMQFTALNTIGFADVPPAHMRDATTLFSVMQQMNAGMGIAVGALALSIAEAIHGSVAGAVSVGDFQLGFWLITAVALLAVADSLLLPADAGATVLARKLR